MGGIQRSVQKCQQNSFKVTDNKSAQEWVHRYTNRYNLPDADFVLNKPSKIIVSWDKSKWQALFDARPNLFKGIPDYMNYAKMSWSLDPSAAHHSIFQNAATTHGLPLVAATVNVLSSKTL